jgi:hypothetical protein
MQQFDCFLYKPVHLLSVSAIKLIVDYQMSQANDIDDESRKETRDTSKAKRRLQLSRDDDEAKNEVFEDDDSFEVGLSQMNDKEYGMFTQTGKGSSFNDVTT